MTNANNADNNLSPWQPGQSGNPSGRPKGTRDLAGYVLETTGGGWELVDSLVSLARGIMPNVPGQEGSRPRKEQQVRPADQLKAIEMLLDRGFGLSPQQLDIPHSVTDRPLKHLSDETLRLLVESANGLEDGSGVVVDEDGQVDRVSGMKLPVVLAVLIGTLVLACSTAAPVPVPNIDATAEAKLA